MEKERLLCEWTIQTFFYDVCESSHADWLDLLSPNVKTKTNVAITCMKNKILEGKGGHVTYVFQTSDFCRRGERVVSVNSAVYSGSIKGLPNLFWYHLKKKKTLDNLQVSRCKNKQSQPNSRHRVTLSFAKGEKRLTKNKWFVAFILLHSQSDKYHVRMYKVNQLYPLSKNKIFLVVFNTILLTNRWRHIRVL